MFLLVLSKKRILARADGGCTSCSSLSACQAIRPFPIGEDRSQVFFYGKCSQDNLRSCVIPKEEKEKERENKKSSGAQNSVVSDEGAATNSAFYN